MTALRHLLLALQFFTRIPVTGRLADWVGYSPQMLRASAAHLPAIGLLIGALAALLYGCLAQALGANAWAPLVAAVFSTVLTLLLTGAFHEDGLADLADGLGGSLDRARALEIMKDSRIGSFGASALVLALLAKVSLLALLGAANWRTSSRPIPDPPPVTAASLLSNDSMNPPGSPWRGSSMPFPRRGRY